MSITMSGGVVIAHMGYVCYTLPQFHAWDASPCMKTPEQAMPTHGEKLE